MKTQYMISGKEKDKVLSVKLKDILKCINISDYSWCLQWIEGSGVPPNMTFLEYEELVNESEYGLLITPKDIEQINNFIITLNNFLLVGKKEFTESVKRINDRNALWNYYDITIELVDSSYWEISTNNIVTKERIEDLLEGVKRITT